MRKLEKPELIETIIDKKKVWLNIRESRLLYMFHRKLISWEEYEAGSRYRLMCELQGGGTGNVIKERIENNNTDFMSIQIGAALAVAEVDEEIGEHLAKIMKLFCWFNYGIIEIADRLGTSERKASNYVHEGLARLSVYYGYKKVRNTIKGQGTKVKRPQIS
tara:strand:- start:8 stop:493 length:486 start_codon:yes stop_codon:yes gene_type:complete